VLLACYQRVKRRLREVEDALGVRPRDPQQRTTRSSPPKPSPKRSTSTTRNYPQHDEAAVSTNFIEGLLAEFLIAKPGNRSLEVNFVAEHMAWFIAHEFGHHVGVHHTPFTFENSFNEPVTVMDKDIRMPMGADLIFGTADDVIMQFAIDAYDPHERYQGVHGTLNTMAFGLSTGKGTALASAAFSGVEINGAGSGAAPGEPLSDFDSLDDNEGDDEDGLHLI
jgi:hypothetical protein